MTEVDTVDKLPGLQFSVKSHTLGDSNAQGVKKGHIHLFCAVRDDDIFLLAVNKLHGYRVFSSPTEEVFDALEAELQDTCGRLESAKQELRRLRLVVADKEAEIARLRGIFTGLEDELGIGT